MKKTISLSRRTVIKGAGGVAIALPWLEAMTRERPARATAPGTTPKRFLAVYWPGGTVRQGSLGDRYTPTGTETEFMLSPILSPLEPVKSSLLITDGLYLMAGDPSKFAVEQLQGGMMAWLTGQVQPGAGNYVKGPSIDQVLAPQLSTGKPFGSLGLAVRWGTGRSHGKLSPLNVCQFQEPGGPIPPRIDPVDTWKTLFGDLGRVDTGRAWEASILDAVDKRYAKLAQRLGAADRQRLEAHLEQIRDLEKRVGATTTTPAGACAAPALIDTSDYNPSSGLHSADDGSVTDLATDAAIPKVGALMMDMIVMAFACDLTSVAFLQWADAEAKYTLPWLGLSQTHYFYENGGGFRPAECEQIYTWYSSQHAYLLRKLASIDVGGHSLLDETVVFFGTESADPASHSKKNMPFLLAGGGLRTGRWVKYAGEPHNNLLVSLLNLFGDPRTTFGDDRCCTGPLPGLV